MAEAVTSRLDDHERPGKHGLRLLCEELFQLSVHCNECGGGYAKIDDARVVTTGKDETTEVSITGDKDPSIGLGRTENLDIRRCRQSSIRSHHQIMADLGEEAGGQVVDVLIEEEPHGTGAT